MNSTTCTLVPVLEICVTRGGGEMFTNKGSRDKEHFQDHVFTHLWIHT